MADTMKIKDFQGCRMQPMKIRSFQVSSIKKMADILKEILKELPEDKISEGGFEGANIVLYTKDKDFFLDNKGLIREAVNKFKKRIELRPDPSIAIKQEKAEKIIKKTIPKEAGIANIIFDPERSRVIVEAEKPGLAIGKQGDIV